MTDPVTDVVAERPSGPTSRAAAAASPAAGRPPSRRSVLVGAGLLGAGGLLAACSGSSGTATTETSAPAPAAGGGEAVGKTADVPVGSGAIFTDVALVVTQPTEGTFKAFGTKCPHMGCAVNEVDGDTIHCPCHGSTFSVVDGSRTGGPAPTGLTPAQITVSGGEIREA